jgi:hypothetical protein
MISDISKRCTSVAIIISKEKKTLWNSLKATRIRKIYNPRISSDMLQTYLVNIILSAQEMREDKQASKLLAPRARIIGIVLSWSLQESYPPLRSAVDRDQPTTFLYVSSSASIVCIEMDRSSRGPFFIFDQRGKHGSSESNSTPD